MTEFSHSEVLFAGDDGLPIQFNIQSTSEKESLKALIEHGGGICTFGDEAIILVSPGTKVVTFLANKNLISSRYVFDCVKEDCLLETDEYRIEINEMEASDFSDSSNLPLNTLTFESNKNLAYDTNDNSIDIIQPVRPLTPHNIICPNSNHDFDFQDTGNRDVVAETYKRDEQQNSHLRFPLESSENHIHFSLLMDKADNLQNCANTVPDSLESVEQLANIGQKKIVSEQFNITGNRGASNDDDPAVAVVSSSQENHGALDQFDNMVLKKVQEKQDDDSLSQSYTVSSSADAQISPNQPPSHNTSAEIFNGSPAAPDSASQTSERQQYINNLEKEVEQILQKPSPKSIQDKIVLVKYICIVKKLAPAIVLQTLQKF